MNSSDSEWLIYHSRCFFTWYMHTYFRPNKWFRAFCCKRKQKQKQRDSCNKKEIIKLFACSLPNPSNGHLDPIMSIDCSLHRRHLYNVEEPSSNLAVSQKTNSRCSRYQPSRSLRVKTSTMSNHGREMERNVGFRASTSTAVNRIS